MEIEWKRQRSRIARLRFGEKKEWDDERTHVVKEGEVVNVRIISKAGVTYDDGKVKTHAVMALIEQENKQVELTVPTRLETDLGWNPKYPKDFIAKEGSIVSIRYLGKDKKSAYLFDVNFGFENNPSMKCQ